MFSMKIIAISLYILSGLLFFYSLTQPVFLFSDHEPIEGLHVLFWGWWGMILGHPGWLANWLYSATITMNLLGKRKIAIILGLIAVAFSLDGFRVTEWYFNEGNSTPIKDLGVGYSYWLAAIGVGAFSTLFSTNQFID